MADTRLTPTAADTEAAIVKRVARLLGDVPYTDTHSSTPASNYTTLTVASDATTRYEAGQYVDWLDDATYDAALITAVAATTLTVSGGQLGATQQAHLANARFRLNPRWLSISIQKAVNDALLSDLYPDLYALYETQITPTPTTAEYYSVAAAAEEGFRAYQKTTSTPTQLLDITPVPHPLMVDTTLSSTNRAIRIPSWQLRDTAQTIFYQYSRIPAVGDLTDGMSRIVEYGAAWRLLAWDEARTDDDDSVRVSGATGPGQKARDSAYFRNLQAQAKDEEEARLRRRYPRRPRTWLMGSHVS